MFRNRTLYVMALTGSRTRRAMIHHTLLVTVFTLLAGLSAYAQDPAIDEITAFSRQAVAPFIAESVMDGNRVVSIDRVRFIYATSDNVTIVNSIREDIARAVPDEDSLDGALLGLTYLKTPRADVPPGWYTVRVVRNPLRVWEAVLTHMESGQELRSPAEVGVEDARLALPAASAVLGPVAACIDYHWAPPPLQSMYVKMCISLSPQ